MRHGKQQFGCAWPTLAFDLGLSSHEPNVLAKTFQRSQINSNPLAAFVGSFVRCRSGFHRTKEHAKGARGPGPHLNPLDSHPRSTDRCDVLVRSWLCVSTDDLLRSDRSVFVELF